MTSVHFKVNCGFARAAIREFSKIGKGHVSREQNQTRTEKFRALFSSTPSFTSNDEIFCGYGHRDSPFTRYSISINASIRKWTNRDRKTEYLREFSTANWERLPTFQKKKHTLSNCKECAMQYNSLQEHFPGPTFVSTTELTKTVRALIEDNKLEKKTSATTATQILAEIEPQFQNEYGVAFTECLTKQPKSKVQLKTTYAERKKMKRKIQRECRDAMNEQFKKSDPLQILAEGQSIQSYKRIRLSQSFQSPQSNEPTTPKQRKHSPNFKNVDWDKESLLQKLENWPVGDIINWTQIANEFHIEGRNKGQIVKEFAMENGIDVTQLDRRPTKTRVRPRKLRLPGVGITVPTHPTVSVIKEEWTSMVTSGELTLGEPCHPQKIFNLTVKTGELKQSEHIAYGRKIPLLDIRKKLLLKHEDFMHLHTDSEIDEMPDDKIRSLLAKRLQHIPENTEQKRDILKAMERTRTIGFWHDHASLLGRGYVLVTVKVYYDPAVFKAPKDCSEASLQALIEEPEIHILAMSSSSLQHQAELITERLHCLKEVGEPLQTKSNIKITDQVSFFTGDKPAAQFERGTQVGGNYPCGSCGTHISRFDDFAHSCTNKPRTIGYLQSLVIEGGPHGKKPGLIKPFEQLTTNEIKTELQTRNIKCTGTTKKIVTEDLKKHLKGVQRVPSLLLTNPTETLSKLNLQKYHIFECEPLHDLKGHLSNLMLEFPNLLKQPLSGEVSKIIDCDLNSKETKRGGDYRLTIIHVLALLTKRDTPPLPLRLIETAVEISEIMYADESKRSPRLILKLFNASWLHFELCKELLFSPKHITHRKMFGIYLHSLCIHAPIQYEIINLKSTNTEHEERLFGQAKEIAHRATNRQPNNVVPNILLRLQAKQKTRAIYTSYQQMCTAISKAANELRGHCTENTKIPHTFLTGRMSSWQLHLQRIAPFLIHGPGIWWHRNDDGSYEFYDGSSNTDYREEGPKLTHFRDTSIENINQTKEKDWFEICNTNIELPTTSICVYEQNGDFRERISFSATNNTHAEVNSETVGKAEEHESIISQTKEDELCIENETTAVDKDVEEQESITTNEAQMCLDEENIDVCSNVNEGTPTYKTKLCTAVFKALGKSSLLEEFDQLRHSIKDSSALVQKSQQTLYKKLMHTIQDQIKAKIRETKDEMKQFKHSFYSMKNFLPNNDVPEYKTLNNKLHYLKKLVSSTKFC